MVQFTPTYFEKNAGFVANQYSGGGCYNLGNFPMFPLKGNLTESPNDMKTPHYTVTDEHWVTLDSPRGQAPLLSRIHIIYTRHQ